MGGPGLCSQPWVGETTSLGVMKPTKSGDKGAGTPGDTQPTHPPSSWGAWYCLASQLEAPLLRPGLGQGCPCPPARATAPRPWHWHGSHCDTALARATLTDEPSTQHRIRLRVISARLLINKLFFAAAN